jgi:hypothetical protein
LTLASIFNNFAISLQLIEIFRIVSEVFRSLFYFFSGGIGLWVSQKCLSINAVAHFPQDTGVY